MDYEKAYKASLKTATQWIKDGCTDKEKICLECVFPELRESEDDKVIRTLYHLVKDHDWLNGATKDEVLAWLNKCKESLHVQETCKENAVPFTDACKDVIVAIEKYLDWLTGYPDYAPKGKYSLRDMLYCLSLLEKQKEQKAAQTSEEKEYIRTLKSLISDFIRDKQPADVAFYQKIYDWLDGRHVEQKPAEWSEEDEKYLSQAIETLEHENHLILADKLKSLRPQKLNASKLENYDPVEVLNRIKTEWPMAWEKVVGKQEWSKEDEKMRERLITRLNWITYNTRTDGTSPNITFFDEIDWLKSLRPQPRTVSVKDATKFGNLEYERGVKDGIQSEKSRHLATTTAKRMN